MLSCLASCVVMGSHSRTLFCFVGVSLEIAPCICRHICVEFIQSYGCALLLQSCMPGNAPYVFSTITAWTQHTIS